MVLTLKKNLAEELFYKWAFNQQVEMLLAWIRNNIPSNNFQYSIDRVQKKYIYSCLHSLTVKKLSEEICLSDRQLRRFSQDWLGMNTEEFILYLKYLSS